MRDGDAYLRVSPDGAAVWGVHNAVRKLVVPANFMTRLLRPAAVVYADLTSDLPLETPRDAAIRHIVTQNVPAPADMAYALNLLGASAAAFAVAAAIRASR